MKDTAKYILLSALLVCVAGGLGFVMSSCEAGRKDLRCKEVDVVLRDDFEFVNPGEVREIIGNGCIGKQLDSIDLSGIEKDLERRTVILKSEAWTTDDGILHISISQRTPKVRCNRGDAGFYIDETGCVFPVHKSYKAEVRTVEGHIPAIEGGAQGQWVSGLLGLVSFIDNSKEWKDRVEKMTVDSHGDLRLQLSGCKEQFIFGSPVEIPQKFKKIDDYFNYIEPSREKDYYKSVNLKFKKQLICRKDI